MTFDASRVRIELCDVMGFDAATGGMRHHQAAEIWLSDEEGKIMRRKKPHARLTDDTRAGVLTQLVLWLQHKPGDPGLDQMVTGITEAGKAKPS